MSCYLNRSRSALLLCLMAVAITTAGHAVGQAQTGGAYSAAASGVGTGEAEEDPGQQERRREGSRVEMNGYFLMASDRITFCALDDSERFQTLENLALQRVAKITGEGGGRVTWQVEGTVTEYSGKNYLLIERAVIQTQ